MDDCLFCKIVRGEIPSFKVYEDEEVLAFMDIFPITKGHLLIIPKKHYKDLLSMESKVSEAIVSAGKKIGEKIISELSFEGFNFSSNQGKAAGQEVFHVHFHLIPRKTGDGLKGWPNKEANMKEIEKIAEILKQ